MLMTRLLVGGGLLVLVGLALLLWVNSIKDKAADKARTEVTTQMQGKVIDDVEAAHNAIATAAADPAARNAECLRHSRTPENC